MKPKLWKPRQTVATLVLTVALVLPAAARANMWESIKEEWEYRPWAVILATPAFIVTSPFMLAKYLVDKISDDGDDEFS